MITSRLPPANAVHHNPQRNFDPQRPFADPSVHHLFDHDGRFPVTIILTTTRWTA